MNSEQLIVYDDGPAILQWTQMGKGITFFGLGFYSYLS